MQRRSFLALALSAGAGSLLTGCGSGWNLGIGPIRGGGGSSTAGVTRLKAQLQLPEGSPVSLPDLAVWTSALTSKAPSATGSVDLGVFAGGTQYAEVRDAERRIVLAGFVSTERTTLSAQSTAELLVYFALGGPLHTAQARPVFLTGLASLPGFESLVQLIRTQLTTQGYVTIEGPLATALADFRKANLSITRVTRGTKVEPNAEDSGIILDTRVDGELKITNNYLRRGKLWLERTGYKTAESTNNDTVLLKTLDLAVPSRYGGWLGTATSLWKGDYLWQPVTMPTEAIPLTPTNALETYYRLSVIGPGATEGDLRKLTSERASEQPVVALKALILDFILPVIANIILPLNGEAIDNATGVINANAAFSDIINTSRQTIPDVFAKIGEGDYDGAVSLLWEAGWTSNSLLPLLATLLAGLFDITTPPSELLGKITGKLSVLGAVDVIASAFDSGLWAHDVFSSKMASVFDITTTKAKITLVADASTLSPTATTNIRAVIQDQPKEAVYTYEWSVSPNGNYFLMDGDQKSTDKSAGGILLSKFEKVFIGSLVNSDGNATVRCKVTRVDKGKQEIGVDEVSLVFTAATSTVLGTPHFEGFAYQGQGAGSSGLWGYYSLMYVVVPKVPNARFYDLVENGYPSLPQRGGFQAVEIADPNLTGFSEIVAQIGPNEYWHRVGGSVSTRYSSKASAEAAYQEAMRSEAAQTFRNNFLATRWAWKVTF